MTCRQNRFAGEAVVYFVEWLRADKIVERSVIDAKSVAKAINDARIQSPEVRARHIDSEPDGFRLLSQDRRENFGVFPLSQ